MSGMMMIVVSSARERPTRRGARENVGAVIRRSSAAVAPARATVAAILIRVTG
jgi:hypothetical protein